MSPRIAAAPAGRCPLCHEPGPVGEPCRSRGCQRRAYHFIPEEHLPGADADLDPMVGRTIDEYLIVSVLGAGGFGKVFLALQRPVLMRAALKLMHRDERDPALEEVKLQKFALEAQALARLTHPHIVRLLKYGVYKGAPYMVMEFVEGGRTLKRDLADRALRGDALDAKTSHHVLRQLVDGLGAAHARDIVHRDVKPDNVMLQRVEGNPDFVRILDFGLAKFVDERTETSMAMGTPVYMAPEQMTRRHIGPWTDLYAVGLIAFEMMTGRRAYGGATAQEIVAMKLDAGFDPVASFAGDLEVPASVRGFFRRALAVHTEERFQSAAEMRDAMQVLFSQLDMDRPEALLSVDLSGLLTSRDLRRRALQTDALAARQRELEAERRELEAERQALEAERRRLSQTPAPALAPTQTVPAPADDVDMRLIRPRRWPLVAAGLLAIGVVVAAIALSDSPTPDATPGVVERVLSSKPEPAVVTRVDPAGASAESAAPVTAEEDAVSQGASDGDGDAALAGVAADSDGASEEDTAPAAVATAAIPKRGDTGAAGAIQMGALKALAEDSPLLGGDVAFDPGALGGVGGATGHGSGGLGLAGSGAGGGGSAAAPVTGETAAGGGASGSRTHLAEAARKKTPTIRSGSAAATGFCDKDVLLRYLRRQQSAFKYCYERELATKPTLAGRVTLNLTIGTDGRVPRASTSSNTTGSDALGRCLVSKVKRAVFPAPDGGICVISYPVTFGQR